MQKKNSGKKSSRKSEDSHISGLPKKVIKLLGVLPDVEIGRRTGIDSRKIQKARNALGINRAPATGHGYKHDYSNVDPLLGTCVDTELAKRFNIPQQCITVRRRHLGIPAFGKSPRKRQWTEEELNDLQVLPVSKICEKHSISLHTVYWKMKELGIRRDPHARWAHETVPDWVYPILGKFLDMHIAEAAGVSRERIRQLRLLRKIPTPCKVSVCREYFEAWQQQQTAKAQHEEEQQ